MRDQSGNLQSCPKIKAKLLNDQFSSVFSPPVEKNVTMKDGPHPTTNPITVTTPGVEKLLKGVKPFKATGPDGIPPFILKELAEELQKTEPLWH